MTGLVFLALPTQDEERSICPVSPLRAAGVGAVMPEKKSRDLNQIAAAIAAHAAGERRDDDPYGGKNPAAVELGRLGGLKGGKARAQKLSKKKRTEIARAAAEARWAKEKKQ